MGPDSYRDNLRLKPKTAELSKEPEIKRWTDGPMTHCGLCMHCCYYFCVHDKPHDGPCICHLCQAPCG